MVGGRLGRSARLKRTTRASDGRFRRGRGRQLEHRSPWADTSQQTLLRHRSTHRWSSRLVATAEQNRLSNPPQFSLRLPRLLRERLISNAWRLNPWPTHESPARQERRRAGSREPLTIPPCRDGQQMASFFFRGYFARRFSALLCEQSVVFRGLCVWVCHRRWASASRLSS
jgi:hypothetical protein